MYIIYLLLCCINAMAITSAGIGITNWQYWVSILCVAGIYICGAERNR